LRGLGELPAARALGEQALDILLRIFPEQHPDVQAARASLAATLDDLGDREGARQLREAVLETRSRSLPADHVDLQSSRLELASSLKDFGDPAGAQVLEEQALGVLSRTLPEDHRLLRRARVNVAATRYLLGDLQGARVSSERALAGLSRSLPDDHPDLQTARLLLATTLKSLGDTAGARPLEEKVLEIRSRALPDDHPDLQSARQAYANTLKDLGDLAGAQALEEKVLEIRSLALRDGDLDLHAARNNLAITLQLRGDFARARTLFELVLDARSRALPPTHHDVQTARLNLAGVLRDLGSLADAQMHVELALDSMTRASLETHPDLQVARAELADLLARRHAASPDVAIPKRCAELIAAVCRAQVRAAREAVLTGSAREAEARCSSLSKHLDLSLSFATGYGVFEHLRALEVESFALSEATRGAALASARFTRRAWGDPKYRQLRDALQHASAGLARLTREGTTNEEFDLARSARESVEHEMFAMARELSPEFANDMRLDVDALAGRLGENDVVVGFRRYTRTRVDRERIEAVGGPSVQETATDSLCAFVVRSSRSVGGEGFASILTLIDLGPLAPIEGAVRGWRDEMGVGSGSRGVSVTSPRTAAAGGAAGGDDVRKRIFDPLLASIGRANRIVIVLDDVLHLVPFDALSTSSTDAELVGDRWRIETRATLAELLVRPPDPEGVGGLLALGGVNYGVEGDEPREAAGKNATPFTSQGVATADILRGGAWAGGFANLPATRLEVEGIATSFRDTDRGRTTLRILADADATRERLLELAPRARYIHVATHGWFAPESIKSWSDLEPLDSRTGLGVRVSGDDQVRAMSPMLLCGLALTGANGRDDSVGRSPGLITADELSTLDLSNCELAVLSACDTNVGERRAGQGVASLQKALQMAGARSVITSLWKVPDEATKELMLDFYRRLWVEKKPKWRALWEAKARLRDARGPDGTPLYTTRDWAAWVLTGEPD
jgi:CHAT domain-containing protein/tetratricopeptide (TPR) repeat protein